MTGVQTCASSDFLSPDLVLMTKKLPGCDRAFSSLSPSLPFSNSCNNCQVFFFFSSACWRCQYLCSICYSEQIWSHTNRICPWNDSLHLHTADFILWYSGNSLQTSYWVDTFESRCFQYVNLNLCNANPVNHWSPIFLAPGTGFVEESFFQRQGWGGSGAWFQDDSLKKCTTSVLCMRSSQ